MKTSPLKSAGLARQIMVIDNLRSCIIVTKSSADDTISRGFFIIDLTIHSLNSKKGLTGL